MKSNGRNISLTSYDDLFSTEESRMESMREMIKDIPLKDLYPFKDHPFKVVDDERMQETVESVKEYGVLVPGIVRPRPGGGYEIISGHRRKRASELAGKETMPVIIRNLDDDAAVIIMVDSNLQRENILPSERAKAYKMKLEAIKRQAGRPSKQNCDQLGHNFAGKRSVEILAENAPDSRNQIQRYIRLTQLEKPLLDMVDEKKIAMNPAVELSYLKPDEQKQLLEAIDLEQSTPSLSQAQRMKKFSQEGRLTFDVMDAILSEEKKPPETHITLTSDKISKFFPKSFTPEQMEKTIIKLLEKWCRSRQQSQER